MKKIIPFTFLGLLFLLTACPQEIKNSIDNGSCPVPSWLAGKWYEKKETGLSNKGYMLVKDKLQGNLKCYEIDSLGTKDVSSQRKIVMSKIDDKIFLSVYDKGDSIEDTPPGFYLYQFVQEGKTGFSITPIKEYTLNYDDEPADILKQLREKKDDATIYEEKEIVHYVKR